MMYWVPVTVATVGAICGLLVGEGVIVKTGVGVAVRLALGVLVAGFFVAVLLGADDSASADFGVFVGGRSVAATVSVAVEVVTMATAEASRVGVALFAP